MKLIIKTTFLFLLLFQFNSLLSQVTGFEIIIQSDSLDITPLKFIRSYNGNGEIGLVRKIPNTVNKRSTIGRESVYNGYNSYIYCIDSIGDTFSPSLNKPDTSLYFIDIIKINYGTPGYLLSGVGYPSNNSDSIFNIYERIDLDFNVMWDKIIDFGYYYSNGSTNSMQLKDSSFIIACTPSNNMFLLHLSYFGDSLNFRNYTGMGDSSGIVQSLTYNPDSTAVWLHTNWAHYNGGGSINSCIQIDNQLNQIGVFHYAGNGTSLPFTSILLPTGSLITGGTTQYYDLEHDKLKKYISAYKHDQSFNLQNKVLLTNADTTSRGGDVIAIDYYDPSCIYLAGTHNLQGFTGSSPSWFYVAKLNDTLGVDFEKYIGGDYYYWLSSVVAAKDGGVLLTGMRSEVNAPLFHSSAYIIKLDSTGCVVSLPENNKFQIHDVFVYPNPGNEYLQIRTALKNSIFYLYNLEGQKVITQPLNNHVTVINTTSLSQGTYVYHVVKDNTAIESGKWIKK